MHNILLAMTKGEHLDIQSVILLIQLLLVIYAVHSVIRIFVTNFVHKYKALKAFRSNMILGVGSYVSIEAADDRFTGHITSVDRHNVIISNEESAVIIDTRRFIESTVIIHNTKL